MLFDAHWRMPRPLEAYSPITHGEALKNPAIVEMAKKYGVSAAPLCIRYVVQLGNRCVA